MIEYIVKGTSRIAGFDSRCLWDMQNNKMQDTGCTARVNSDVIVVLGGTYAELKSTNQQDVEVTYNK